MAHSIEYCSVSYGKLKADLAEKMRPDDVSKLLLMNDVDVTFQDITAVEAIYLFEQMEIIGYSKEKLTPFEKQLREGNMIAAADLVNTYKQLPSTPEKSLSPTINSFGELETLLCCKIQSKNVLQLCALFQLTAKEKEAVCSNRDPTIKFMDLLIEKGVIFPNNVARLQDALTQLNLNSAATLVKSYSEAISETETKAEYLSTDMSISSPGKSDYTDCRTDNERTVLSNITVRQSVFNALVKQLRLEGCDTKKLTITDVMQVTSHDVSGLASDNVIEYFVTRITSYDYRVQNILRRFKKVESPYETKHSNIISETVTEKVKGITRHTRYSSRDILYVIFNFLDPFLLQDVLAKLSACHMATPVLLPNVTGQNVRLLLWGLRRIAKSWYNIDERSTVREETIVRRRMLTVAAVRFGKIPVSKSNVLNKLLGPIQGNDEHPFFISFEQDSSPAVLSEGIVECVWFLPGTEIGHISSPFALLNLRGDYFQHKRQAEFAVDMAFVTIVFIDANMITSYKDFVDNIRSSSHVIVVCCLNSSQGKGGKKASRTFSNVNYQLTRIYSQGMSALEISREISNVIKDLFKRKDVMLTSLEYAANKAQTLQFEIDEKQGVCVEAKQLAEEVSNEIKTSSPNKYKLIHFPIQTSMKDRSETDKYESWKTEGKSAIDKNKEMDVQTNLQLSEHMRKICNFLLNQNREWRSYFISWLQMYFRDIFTEVSEPLMRQLIGISSETRYLSTKFNTMTKLLQKDTSTIIEREGLSNLRGKESKLTRDKEKLIKKINQCSLDFENYMREFGEYVEINNSNTLTDSNSVHTSKLPKLAAEMLLNGEPIEILDDDVRNVPMLWLMEVFKALESIRKYAKVYVISVLGTQSSGKTTLLNSMFGLRFAGSSKRFSKGVFIQLLPIKDEVQETLKCDYLVLVDTKGFCASSETLNIEQDNKLATFVLAISNLTLINIGGQIVTDYMSNVLQIAAFACVRMTNVTFKPGIRFVQQFVTDVTADQKNDKAMQTVLMKLNQATREAARMEKKEHLFKQFSDVFVVHTDNLDESNASFIPSLQRGFMVAPDYRYGIGVQQLKSTILQSVKSTTFPKVSLIEFQQRIANAWKAIKEENVVFRYKNVKEVLQIPHP